MTLKPVKSYLVEKSEVKNMRLAKRYVREFAADKKKYLERVRKHFEQEKMPEMAKAAKASIEEVDNVVNQCDYGYISSFEAVKLLSK